MPNKSSYAHVAVRSKPARHSVDHRAMKPYDKPDDRHAEDAYWTPPVAVTELLKVEEFAPSIWEPACGTGNISKVLHQSGFDVLSTDKYDWGYGTSGIDFLAEDAVERYLGFPTKRVSSLSIITNAPYRIQLEFMQRAADVVDKFAFLMRLQYLEGKERWKFYKRFHINAYIMGRLPFEVNGKVRRMVPYVWMVFDQTKREKRLQLFDLQNWRYQK